ncbi:hypothetical protein E2C01_078076 [Portunus trituberculatus]|uniref:Uncharacterized protein n=1 Tax=Portunus trituberculatus TaxID=210409 RepID=A0A5B7INY8_PORTR|nr:hypothetical protein [Portunus trituberculatus]
MTLVFSCIICLVMVMPCSCRRWLFRAPDAKCSANRRESFVIVMLILVEVTVDFFVEGLVRLLYEDVEKRHGSVGAIFYAEVKAGGFLDVMSKLFYVGLVLRFDDYVVYISAVNFRLFCLLEGVPFYASQRS